MTHPWTAVVLWTAAIFLLVFKGKDFSHLAVRAFTLQGLHLGLRLVAMVVVLRLLQDLFESYYRAGPLRTAAGLLCIILYGALLWGIKYAEEILHVLEYSPLGVLIFLAVSKDRPFHTRFIIALALATIIGVADENTQSQIPGRMFDPGDIFLNTIGSTLTLVFFCLTRPEE